MLKPADPALVGNLEDIKSFLPFPTIPTEKQDEAVKLIAQSLRGEREGLQIPRYKNEYESVAFFHRELLIRIASLTIPLQEAFIGSISSALRENKAESMRLNIPWGRQNSKWMTAKLGPPNVITLSLS